MTRLAVILLAALTAVAALASTPHPPVTGTYDLATYMYVLETDTGRKIRYIPTYGDSVYWGRVVNSALFDDMEADCGDQLGEPCTIIFFAPILTPR